jgi:hypothetical protein
MCPDTCFHVSCESELDGPAPSIEAWFSQQVRNDPPGLPVPAWSHPHVVLQALIYIALSSWTDYRRGPPKFEPDALAVKASLHALEAIILLIHGPTIRVRGEPDVNGEVSHSSRIVSAASYPDDARSPGLFIFVV